MSKYTLQLRWLVEQSLADVLVENKEDNWHLIYDRLGLADYPIFDEAYRSTLNNQIIRHYYMHEIGAETAGLFKFFMRDAMHLIMPYYNEQYKSLAVAEGIMPFEDVNVTESWKRAKTERADGTSSTDTKADDSSIFSDTPNNALNLDNIKNGQYATTANFDSRVGTSSDTYANTVDTGETYDRASSGYNRPQSELLLLWRSTFVNIDLEVVEHEKVRECFMMIW